MLVYLPKKTLACFQVTEMLSKPETKRPENVKKRDFLKNVKKKKSFLTGLRFLTGHAGVVTMLLRANVDSNVRGYLGATALCRASRKGHLGVMEALLAAPGINCDIANYKMQVGNHSERY